MTATKPSTLLLSVSGALAMAACSTPAPPPATPSSPPADAAPAVVPAEPTFAATSRTGFGAWPHSWVQETNDWNGGLAIAPSGDVLAFSNGQVRVLARDDGRVLHTAKVCSPVTEDAVAWVAPSRLWIACDREIVALSFPTLAAARVTSYDTSGDNSLSTRIDRAALGGGVLVAAQDGFFAANKRGTVRVYAIDGAKLLDSFEAPAEIEALAVWPDGKRFLYATDKEVYVRTIATRSDELVPNVRGRSGFRVAPAGDVVFGPIKSFRVGAFEPSGTASRVLGTFDVGSWTIASRWLPGGSVVATGSDGLGLFPSDGLERIGAPVDDLGEGLAVSEDGGTVCAGGRSGKVACFFAKKPAPTELAKVYADTFGPGATSTASEMPPIPDRRRRPKAEEAPEASTAVEGTFVRRAGKRLVLKVSSEAAAAMAVAQTQKLSKRVEFNLGGLLGGQGVATGWLVLATVRVESVHGDEVTLLLEKESAAVRVNGKPVDHYREGQFRLEPLGEGP